MSRVSPIILLIAACLDIFGLLCLALGFIFSPELGETFSFIPDFLGLFFIGGHEIFAKRRQAFSQVKGVRKKAIAKAKKKGGLKFFLYFLGELLPLIGAFPFWTIFVLSSAKKEKTRAP